MHGKISTDPQRLMALFAGHSKASGTHGIPELDDNGVKWSIKKTAKTLSTGATLEWWLKHLEGKRPLGIVPICEDATCTWGSIDVDQYDIDPVEVIKKVIAYKLPLVPCRSKSGGLHLFAFASEPVPAAVMQAMLGDMAALLGFAGCEIFPKQTKMNGGASGNWMIAPYFGSDYDGKIKFQYGLKKTGAEMTLGEFIDIAEASQQTAASLEAFKIKHAQPNGESNNKQAYVNDAQAPFGDGPPCLQHMAENGFPDGSRNNALFHIGVYLKKAHPIKWEEMLGDDNQKHMKPPLPHEEVESLKRSLRKKDYLYKCKDQPMASHCDTKLCCTRRFGVGDGETVPVIVKWRKLMLEKPVHYVTIKGSETEMKIEHYKDIALHQSFIIQCGGQLKMVFPPMTPLVWSKVLKEYAKLIVEEQPSEDITEAGVLHEMMEDFLTNSMRGQRKEDILRGAPWEDEENEVNKETRHYFRMRDFEAFLKRSGWQGTRNDIGEFIRGLGGDGGKGVDGKKVVKLSIKNQDVCVWYVPSAVITKAVTLDLPREREEVM